MTCEALEPIPPLPYHNRVRDHFRTREPGLWKWFRERETIEALREGVRLDLLKTSVRLARDDRPELYTLADTVATQLGLTDVVTLYQSQGGDAMNARLCFAPGEIHIAFQGLVLERATTDELRALLGHELSHYRFFTADEGEFLTSASILNALTQSEGTEFAHAVTARNHDLYTEILCDRGALAVCGSPLPVISVLVKVETGLSQVNPESYLQQADEIFAQGPVETAGVSHPETFLRARALDLWHRGSRTPRTPSPR